MNRFSWHSFFCCSNRIPDLIVPSQEFSSMATLPSKKGCEDMCELRRLYKIASSTVHLSHLHVQIHSWHLDKNGVASHFQEFRSPIVVSPRLRMEPLKKGVCEFYFRRGFCLLHRVEGKGLETHYMWLPEQKNLLPCNKVIFPGSSCVAGSWYAQIRILLAECKPRWGSGWAAGSIVLNKMGPFNQWTIFSAQITW
jgi:hypothetical protein